MKEIDSFTLSLWEREEGGEGRGKVIQLATLYQSEQTEDAIKLMFRITMQTSLHKTSTYWPCCVTSLDKLS